MILKVWLLSGQHVSTIFTRNDAPHLMPLPCTLCRYIFFLSDQHTLSANVLPLPQLHGVRLFAIRGKIRRFDKKSSFHIMEVILPLATLVEKIFNCVVEFPN